MDDTLNWLEEERLRLFTIERERENPELRKYLDSQMGLVEDVFIGDDDFEEIKEKLKEYLQVGKERSENFRKTLFELSDQIDSIGDLGNGCFDESQIKCLLERASILSSLNEHDKSIVDSELVLEILSKSNRCRNFKGEVEEKEICDHKKKEFQKEAFFRKSFSYNGKRNFKCGFKYSKKALEIDPEYVDALVQFGRSKYRVGGSLDDSLSIADNCVKKSPDHHLSHWLRSSLLEQLHRSNEAMEEVKIMKRIKPYHPWSLLQLASIFDELKSHENSVKFYTYSIVLDPRDPLFYYNRGYSLKRVKKNYSLAYKDFTTALILDHADIEAWNNRGIISSEEMDSLPDAERDFSCAVHFDPTHSNSFYNRGVIREGLGKIMDSFDDFTEAIRLKPDSDVYYYRAYVCYHHLSESEDDGDKYLHIAVSDLLKFRELLPEDKEGMKLRTVVCTRAVEVCSEYLEGRNPLDITMLQRRANAYRGLDKSVDMKKDLGKIAALVDLKERYTYLLANFKNKFSQISLLSDQKIKWFKILLHK